MALGTNIHIEDKLIKKTTHRIKNTSNTNITSKIGRPSTDPKATTFKTSKMTFYVKADLRKRLYNFAYWDRQNITTAFNRALADGLKGKTTKNKP